MYSVLMILILLMPTGGAKHDTHAVPVPKRLPPVTMRADSSETTGKLAKALQRLQAGEDQQAPKARYRLVQLLGGKLTARVRNP